ncbi:MAG TPA: O-antigen ligase family protein [Ktedonobacteraceae bacterium]
MKNQDLAQSTRHVASTPSPGSEEGEMRPADGVVNEISQTSAQVVDAPLEPKDTPRAPAEGREGASVEAGSPPFTPAVSANDAPPPETFKVLRGLSPFWHDRLIEAGLILSMGLYYLVGNSNFGGGNFLHLPPYLYSFPFLAIFAFLSWYRLSFAVALLPLSLPYYLVHKTVFSYGAHFFDFSLVEISLYTCVLVAVGQLLVQGKRWRYRLTWGELRARLGLFIIPVAVFFLAALVSIAVAVDRQAALRAFREEVIGPLIYVLLALCCLRTRADVKRLLWAFLGCALIVALAGLIQHFFLASQLLASKGGDGRAHAMYGSANSIGLFFDYALPIGIALLIFQIGKALKTQSAWWSCLALLLGFVPLVGVLYLSQSLGSALALPVALLFILALSVRSRKLLLIGTVVLVVVLVAGGVVLRHQITHFLSTWHDNSKGISTISKRYYLWMSAWHMIQAHPVFGVGMDNWLCHYSLNGDCQLSKTTPVHYWVTFIPGTNLPTGLHDEPGLSHPHDIFLHVWVSMGIFGLLAFVAIVGLFFWLFARIVKTVRGSSSSSVAGLEWMVLGVGAAMLAALCQGLIDSAFLEQDLAFCFWMLFAALLILRVQSGTDWRGRRAD